VGSDPGHRADKAADVTTRRQAQVERQLELLVDAPSETETTRTGTDEHRASRTSTRRVTIGGRPPLPRLSVSPDEAAGMLGVSRDYLDEHILCELRSVRRGRRILIAVHELERWLESAGTRRPLRAP
jgi:excisionase family DNA binding protein